MSPMNPHEKKLHEIICVAGREFPVYIERDELGDMTPNYPDFTMDNPVYTDKGWPFVRLIRHWKPCDKDSTFNGDCGCCGWLYLESENDIIGVCKCDAYKRPDTARETKEEEK